MRPGFLFLRKPRMNVFGEESGEKAGRKMSLLRKSLALTHIKQPRV